MTENSTTSSIDINKIIAKIVEDNAEKIFSKGAAFLKDQFQKTKVDFGIGFKKYLEKSYEKYSKIKTLIYRHTPKQIYDFFEPNDLLFNNSRINSSNTRKILDISRYLIIEGTGGIGKSMLMKHLFLSSLEEGNKIPVFVELKDVNSFEGDLVDFIWHSMNMLGLDYEKEYFRYAIESGQFIFLLDGFDEIYAKNRPNIFKQIDEMCDRYTENHYVVSSRPAPDEFVSFQRFSILKAQPLTKKQAIGLVARIEYDIDIKTKFLSELKESLYDKHQSFASNPLLLNIMLLTYDNYAEIPEKLHIFYAQAFEALYSKHDATKAGYRREMKTKLTLDQFSKAFSLFCFQTFTKGKISFTTRELQNTIGNIAERFGGLVAEDLIGDLENAICLLRKDGLEYYFTHRSFQEYFTAFYIRELNDDQQRQVYARFLNVRRFDRLSPESVLMMLYDMSEERFEQNAILPILNDLHDAKDTADEQYIKHLSFLSNGIAIDSSSQFNTQKQAQSLTPNICHLLIAAPPSTVFLHIIRYATSSYNLTHKKPACIIPQKEIAEFTCIAEQLDAAEQLNDTESAPRKHLTQRPQRLSRMDTELDTSISLRFSVAEIANYPILLNFVKASWVGELVEATMALRGILEERQKNSVKELNDMLDL